MADERDEELPAKLAEGDELGTGPQLPEPDEELSATTQLDEPERRRPRIVWRATTFGGTAGKGWRMARPGELDDDIGNSGP